MDWGQQLSKFISAAEGRVASYKQLKGEAYKNDNKELILLFKEIEKDEERWLKNLRQEKTDWNNREWLRPKDNK